AFGAAHNSRDAPVDEGYAPLTGRADLSERCDLWAHAERDRALHGHGQRQRLEQVERGAAEHGQAVRPGRSVPVAQVALHPGEVGPELLPLVVRELGGLDLAVARVDQRA